VNEIVGSSISSLMSEYAKREYGKKLVINYSICPSAEEVLGFPSTKKRYYNSLFSFRS